MPTPSDTPRPASAPQAGQAVAGEARVSAAPQNPFLRAANEDDDGYDPYSDRPCEREPLYERDPWN